MTHLALFRGINVGGKNIVQMAELRHMLTGLGFQNVQTYIQSGNAIFDAEDAPEAVAATIHAAFPAAFGFECAVLVRTREDIRAVVDSLPFSQAEIAGAEAACSEIEHLYYYFAQNPPEEAALDALNAAHSRGRLALGPGGVYLLCLDSVRDSKLAAALSKLNPAMTVRNWKTMNKLHSLM